MNLVYVWLLNPKKFSSNYFIEKPLILLKQWCKAYEFYTLHWKNVYALICSKWICPGKCLIKCLKGNISSWKLLICLDLIMIENYFTFPFKWMLHRQKQCELCWLKEMLLAGISIIEILSNEPLSALSQTWIYN